MGSPSGRKDERLNARRWLNEAQRQLNDEYFFNAYFSAYVALVAASAASVMRRGGNQIDRDDDCAERIAIESSMKNDAKNIDDFLIGPGRTDRDRLCRRQVEYGDDYLIAKSSNVELNISRDRLLEYWSPIRTERLSLIEAEDQALQLANLFRIVRNRLFHGRKMYDRGGPDADLFERLTPVLLGVVDVMSK